MEGSHAVAHAVKACRPDVVAAYPITPQTHVVEELAQMVADCELDVEYVNVESEHSAMSACVGAAAAGSRTYTATASQGLALMFEVLFNASGMRLPIVMTNCNRALSAPISIWNDQQDSVSARDAGWIQLYAEDVQEAADQVIQAYRIGEDERVRLPVMVNMDGFVLTHTYEPAFVPEGGDVDSFLPPYEPEIKLDASDPRSFGEVGYPEDYTEFRYQQQLAMDASREVIREVAQAYCQEFDREDYGGLIQRYHSDDADTVLISLGSMVGTMKDAVDGLRNDGESVGLVKLRSLRPFPEEELYDALEGAKRVAVLEKDVSIGLGGAVHGELAGTMFNRDLDASLHGFVTGLGGRDVTVRDVGSIYRRVESGEAESVEWVNVDENRLFEREARGPTP